MSLNPLALATYYRRHKRYALLLMGLITLVTLGLHVMVGLLDSFLENAYNTQNYLRRFSLVYLLEATDVSQVRVHPDVARVIPEKGLHISVPSLASYESFHVLGVSEDDMQALMDICDMRLGDGRLPRPRTNEIALSEEIAKALELQIGDRIGRSINERYYGSIPTELMLVGILESDRSMRGERSIHVGFVSYEYIDSHELYKDQPSALVVVAQEGRKAAVDTFLETAFSHVEVQTYGRLSAFFDRARGMLYVIFGVVDCLVALVVALVVGVINQIALAQRLAEFGLLHAIGHSKKRLIRRVTLETTAVAGTGWVAGLALSWLIFAWLKTSLYEPRGMELNLANLTPLWFTIPIPLAVIGFVAFGTTRTFARLDAVAIIERGKLSVEARDRWREAKRSSIRPLSSWTFYLRHRRRGVMLIMAVALMILGIALPVFFISSIQDTRKPFLEYLRHVSVVSPVRGGDIDPGVTAQIRTHPAVARVVPVARSWLAVSIPPLSDTSVTIYGVPEDDLPVLVDLYGMRLREGRLPRARSNEIALSEAIALNRGLRVGDTVGRPVYERDGFPTEMVVVGILSLGKLWVGFTSYEYHQSHELYSSGSTCLLVVPAEGYKTELDTWLEKNVASSQTVVQTYGSQLREMQQSTQSMLILFAGVESIIAIVAAIALATLNYIFFSQRREEFGVLHAIGHGRLWLLLRTVRETMGVVAVAWAIGATVCVISLLCFQTSLYAPKGLGLDLFNPGPWLFTLPIPLAIIAASAATIARMLFKLDPVSVIERR